MIPKGDRNASSAFEVESATVNGEKADVVARQLVVQLATPGDGGDVDAQVKLALSSLPDGARVIRGPSRTGRLVVLLPDNAAVDEVMNSGADSIASNDAIRYVEPDVIDRAQMIPNDPRYPQQWAPPAVGAEDAWDLETGNGAVVIGIIDSGLSITGPNPDHDDLNNAARITFGTDFVDGGTPRDLNAHGTHVAGIAAGVGNNAAGIAGMNWGSPVYITRTLDAAGNGTGSGLADAIEEITDHAVALGIHAVINYSAGGPDTMVKRDACQYASDNGMLVVAATGNDNGGAVLFPAAYSTTIAGVIAVGSTDVGDTVSSFSNVGPEVTVVAPGRGILSATPTYSVNPAIALNFDTFDGTSMATPLVTGLVALMWSRHPGHTNVKVKQCLTDTAVKLGAGNFDNSWGFGRVDALAALKCGDPFVLSFIGSSCPNTLIRCARACWCHARATDSPPSSRQRSTNARRRSRSRCCASRIVSSAPRRRRARTTPGSRRPPPSRPNSPRRLGASSHASGTALRP